MAVDFQSGYRYHHPVDETTLIAGFKTLAKNSPKGFAIRLE